MEKVRHVVTSNQFGLATRKSKTQGGDDSWSEWVKMGQSLTRRCLRYQEFGLNCNYLSESVEKDSSLCRGHSHGETLWFTPVKQVLIFPWELHFHFLKTFRYNFFHSGFHLPILLLSWQSSDLFQDSSRDSVQRSLTVPVAGDSMIRLCLIFCD